MLKPFNTVHSKQGEINSVGIGNIHVITQQADVAMVTCLHAIFWPQTVSEAISEHVFPKIS